mgnify:FL=1
MHDERLPNAPHFGQEPRLDRQTMSLSTKKWMWAYCSRSQPSASVYNVAASAMGTLLCTTVRPCDSECQYHD